MMKKWFLVIIISAISTLFFPSTIRATEEFKSTKISYIKEQENGEYCIDLDEVYKYVNDESKVFTGVSNGIDASKKANTISALVNIQTILGGSDGFCIKDKEAAINAGLLKNNGILGFLEEGNSSMMAYFPTVNVVDHLAQTFVPGYEGNNSTLAQGNSNLQCETSEKFCSRACNYYSLHEAREAGFDMQIETGFGYKYSDCFNKCRAEDTTCYSTVTNGGPTFMHLAKNYGAVKKTDQEIITETSQSQEAIAKRCEGKLEMDSRISDKLEESIKNNGVLKLADNFNRVDGTPLFEKQTSGYSYLKDDIKLDKIWSKFRNIAYVLYVVILIVIGFMIMFRNKIGGQMMISISNSIPQLIIGLIFVTFSFAIVGIALDIGKMLMVVSNNIFLPLNGTDTTYIDSIANMTDSALQKVNERAGFEGLLGDECADFVSPTGQTVQGATRGLKDHVWDVVWGGLLSAYLTTLRQSVIADATPISSILKAVLDLGITTFNIPITVILVYNVLILLICAYAAFKLFITMFTTYIKIFMNVILAPLQILMGSLPGNSSALMNWFKSVFANVLVFPAIFIVINFAIYLGNNINSTENFNFFGNSGVVWPSLLANLRGVILIGAYIFCSNLPGVINGFLKVGESKEIASAGESTKKALGKLPLIGGMFG